MEKSVSSRLRVSSIVAAAVIVLSSISLTVPAHADTAPTNPADPKTPATVTADALPTPQINGVVWSQTIVGNTVYVGGNFTTAQPYGAASGVSTVSRTYLLSYNLTTGALNTAFAPVLNGQVRAVTASPDGSRVYIGGQFTTVNGANAYRVAALDPTTGAMVTSFTPTINSTVNAIVANGSTVYIGGVFSSVNKETHNKVAALTTAGKNVPFTASADGGDVAALAVSPDGSKIVVGGNFTTLNGSSNPGFGLGAVDATGALQPWAVNNLVRNAGTQAGITSLTSDATGVYGSGYTFGPGTLEGSFRADWATGALNWVEDCHGDTYSVAVTENAEYVAGHPHYCGNIGGFPQTDPDWTFHRAIAFSKTATQTATADPYGYYNWAGNPAPSLLNWYPEFNTGTFTGKTQGPWSVAANSQYVVYGGEFTTVNGVRQQGLTRFAVASVAPKKMGPQASGATFVPKVVSLSSGTARISWIANSDPDNATLTYSLYRNGSTTTPVYTTKADSSVWNKPAMGFTDTGLTPGATYSYRLRATDPDGNTVLGDAVNVTITAKAASTYTNTVLGQGATNFWRLDEASGSTVYDTAGYTDQVAGSGVTRGATGATGDTDTASTFDGSATGFTTTQSAITGPQTFSLEAWVKTTTTTGGKIVGFGNSPTGTSTSYDRHLYMDPTGKVNFGVYDGNTQTITSPTALNDGQWHQVVGTLSSAGMTFFVDGKRVGTRTDVTSAQSYSGYWRIGGDSSWYGDNFLKGSIDDVSVYSAPLSQTQVNNQYVAAGYASQLNSAPTDNSGSRIFTDNPTLYYRLGDAAGSSSAKDSSLTATNGIYTGGVTQGTTGAVNGLSDTAATFDGSSGQVDSAQSFYDPEVYSVEAWFKTTTTTGGKIVGFGSSQTGQSGSYDRHVYMQDDGKLVFGTYTGVTNTITTAGAYNDGGWHQVVATQSSDGLKLYVDGALQGTNAATQAQAYTGYWKIGGDTTWGSTSAYFAGSIDEVAIYDRALAAATVSDHYALGTAGTVNTPPTASFTSTPTNLSAAFDASASADSDGTVASYAWDFGDGSTATGKTPSHTYATAGTKTVTLVVTDDKGATATTTGQVSVTAPRVNVAPTASFTSTATDLSAAFDASASTDSDGTVAGYAWDFGDGTTGSGKTTTHVYATAGTYPVKLTVTDNDSATGVSTASVTVTAPRVNVAPTASFTAATTNLGVSVDGTASFDPDGTIASYAWDFGDSSTASTATASHTYVAAGTYTVKLTVTDNEGAKGVSTKTVTVAPPANVPPTSSFTSSVNALAASFDASASADSDGSVASYAWNYGDSTTGTGKTASHTYAAAGTYTVTLTVTDNQGATGVSTKSVTVAKAPNVAPTASFTASTSGLTLSVNGSSSNDPDGTVASYAWTFGDGSTATTTTPTTTHAYATGSAYSVKLTVTDDAGATGVQTQSVTVTAPAANQAPVAAFTSTVTNLTAAVDASGSSDPDGTIASYAWNFGDSATATGKTQSHTYATAGTYTVTLTVKDDKGAATTKTATVSVTAPAAAPFALDAFGRTVTNGFGTADVGGAWTRVGSAANLSVKNGAGTIALTGPSAQAGAWLGDVAQTDTDMRLQFSLDKAATGGGTYLWATGRKISTNNEYRATIRLLSNGTATVSLTSFAGSASGTSLTKDTLIPVTVNPGTNISVRLQVFGTNPTTIRAKVWATGTAEPTAWTVSATDSSAALQAPGGVGIMAYESGSATNGAQVVSVQQLSAFKP